MAMKVGGGVILDANDIKELRRVFLVVSTGGWPAKEDPDGCRWAMSGPNANDRRIARILRLQPAQMGMSAPPLAIDGHAYHQRQRNRVKRGRR